MGKLADRIKWIQESGYSDEWKAQQVAGAIRTAETIESKGNFKIDLMSPEVFYPQQNPNDLPRDVIDPEHYE